MLPSNGKEVKQRRNYHMSLKELATLLNHLKSWDPKYYVLVLFQAMLGLRASEALAIQMWDFSEEFKYVTYRQAKTNKIIEKEPVPEQLRQLIMAYIYHNKHRLIDGYLFPNHTGKGHRMTTESYGTLWSKWRKQLAKNGHDGFIDKYTIAAKTNGRLLTRYRISSHSLRRLHRTILWKDIKNYKIVMELCHYDDYKSFERYINEFELMEKKDDYLMNVLNPIANRLTMFAQGQQQLTSFG